MEKLLNKIVKDNLEIIMYLIFGFLATIINIAVYIGLAHFTSLNTVTSNTWAIIISVLFAYITNKIFVFKSKKETNLEVIKECISFFIGRGFTGLIDTAILYLGVDILNFSDFYIKILSSIIVIILNYIISKLIIFKKNGDIEMADINKNLTNIEMPQTIWKDRKRIIFGLPWSFTKYSLTDDRIFVETGLLSSEENETRLYRILDIQLRRSIWQKMFNLGTIKINSSDKSLETFELKNIKRSKEVKELISTKVEEQRTKHRVSSRELMMTEEDNEIDYNEE